MKTFLMIHHKVKGKLLYEYEEKNDPISTFYNWYFNSDVDIPFEKLNEIKVFYFTGSEKIEDRKSGILEFDSIEMKMANIEYPLYHIFYDEYFNCIYHHSQHIIWCNNTNSYRLSIVKNNDLEEFDDLDDFSLPLDIVIPPMELFNLSKRKVNFFSRERGRKHIRFEHNPLIVKSFYKKCRSCKCNSLLDIEEMVNGKFSCKVCHTAQ